MTPDRSGRSAAASWSRGAPDVALFDRFSGLYDRLLPSANRRSLRRGLAAATRPVERGIDLAGGAGRGARAVPAVEWIVLDAARGMCRQAAVHGLAAAVADAGRLPVPDGSVDAVMIVDALHHLPDAERALAEASRVLAPGGVVVVRDVDPATVPGAVVDRAEAWMGFGSTFRSPTDVAALAAGVGLDPDLIDAGVTYTVAGVKPGEE